MTLKVPVPEKHHLPACDSFGETTAQATVLAVDLMNSDCFF